MSKTIDGKKYSWNQAICAKDYERLQSGRRPVALKEEFRQNERCAWCGEDTREGIYLREDPATLPHPTPEDE